MKKLKYLLALVVVAQLFACGLSNTMYNARLYFKTASERPLNSNGKPTPQAVDEYTKAIKKCGIIITERKNGKQLEEALFIMAKALYLKGNSAFQAKDQFDNLIRLNPDGKYVPDAYIFQARVLRDINKAKEAEALLEGFVRDPQYRKQHPRALLTLADFSIQDKDYLKAQFWLEKIINEYPKTPEYREAFFLFGKNYYVQSDFDNSLLEFTKLVKVRGLSKDMRLDAWYYIGLDHYELNNYSAGLKAINYVIKNELRPEQLAKAKVLKGNLFIGSGEEDKGKAELEAVLKDYPRTAASSSAAYSLGYYYFYRKLDKTNALANYNRVRTEYPSGDLVASAQTKVTAITQISQTNRLDSETNLQPFLDYYYIAADNYYDQLSLPDSSFVMYRRLLEEKPILTARLDSLNVVIDSLKTRLDSLDVLITSFAPADSAVTDSLSLAIQDSVPGDSLSVATADSLSLEDIVGMKTELEQKLNPLSNRQKSLSQVLERFDREVIPFVNFARANLYAKLERKDPEIAQILDTMQREYPENKYTNAIRMLYNGEKVRIIDPREEKLERDLDLALGLDTAAPDSMLVLLRQISSDGTADMQLKANFRLGWFYAIERADTTSAKAYFDAVLKDPNSGDYGRMTRNFFDGTNFLIYRDIPLPDSSSAIADSLSPLIPADSTAVSDSLSPAKSETEPVSEEQAQPSLNGEQTEPSEPQPAFKEEQPVPPAPETPPGSFEEPTFE